MLYKVFFSLSDISMVSFFKHFSSNCIACSSLVRSDVLAAIVEIGNDEKRFILPIVANIVPVIIRSESISVHFLYGGYVKLF